MADVKNTRRDGAPVLVGMRGSGKSTVARQLASRLGCDYVDADDLLQARIGMPIREMFATHGEDWFRAQEQATLLELLQDQKRIIATGGGAVLHSPVRALLKMRLTIWLDAPADLLVQRIKDTDRPRLDPEAEDMHAELERVLAARKALYAEVAAHRINTGHTDLAQVVEKIVEITGPLSFCRDAGIMGQS